MGCCEELVNYQLKQKNIDNALNDLAVSFIKKAMHASETKNEEEKKVLKAMLSVLEFVQHVRDTELNEKELT